MRTLFTGLYEFICGKNQSISEYRERIYGNVGSLTFIVAIVLTLLFYLALGRWRNVWYTRVHWAITIVLAALAGFGLAYSMAKGTIGSVDGYLIQFALMNAALLAVYFMLLSLLLKKFSIYSKRIPF